MTTRFKDYTVDIIDDSDFSLDSADNLFLYDNVYFDHKESLPTSKHGIKITKDGQKVTSAIICETGGATGIYDNSFVLKDDTLLVCCCDTVYSFKLPELTLNWKKEFDLVTCFAIYPFKDDFIIHGELEIKRIDLDGNVKWSFAAKDIFVTQNGTDAIRITGNKIQVTDWDGNRYILNEDGQLKK